MTAIDWFEPTGDLIRAKRAEANVPKESVYECCQRHGYTVKRWGYSDFSGIVAIASSDSVKPFRLYHTCNDTDDYLYQIFRRILCITLDAEDCEVRLNQTTVSNVNKDLANLYNHPHIKVVRE